MKRSFVIFALGIAALVATPARALDYKFRIFAGVAYMIPISDGDFSGVSTEAADELGWEFGAEWKFSKLLGAELCYMKVNPDIESLGTTVGNIDLEPISASLNFHIVRTTLLTWWVAPTVSYANWGSFEPVSGATVATDSEWAYGASTGVNVSLVKLFALNVSVRWLKLDVTSTATGDSLDVDPFFVNLGIAARF